MNEADLMLKVINFVDQMEDGVSNILDIDDFEAFMIKVAEELRERYLEEE